MNILTGFMPNFISVGERRLKVRTDFRIWIEFDRLLHDSEIMPMTKFSMITALCLEKTEFPTELEPDAVMEALCDFYIAGEKAMPRGGGERIFSPSEDGGYIYAAFLSEYGIDLVSIPYMHWFAFSALIRGLSDDCRLMKIMSFRAAKPELEKNSEKRRYLRKMKELYALQDYRTNEELDRDFAAALAEI